ncbi:MAG: hypothetical protein WC421_03745 [Elusimicrobiales bacterium]
MKLYTEITPRQFKEINSMVESGKYPNMASFISVAIENQISSEDKGYMMNKGTIRETGMDYFERELVQHGFSFKKSLHGNSVSGYIVSQQHSWERPVRINTASEKRFVVKKEWERIENLLLVYIWTIGGSQRIFLLDYQDAVDLLDDKLQTESWVKKGWYSLKISSEQGNFMKDFKKHESNWDILKPAA